MEKTLPEKKFKAGAISATIWKNEGKSESDGKDYSFYSINLDRSYTDKEGKWQKTNSLRANDLPKAILVLNKAYEFVILKKDTVSLKKRLNEVYDVGSIAFALSVVTFWGLGFHTIVTHK